MGWLTGWENETDGAGGRRGGFFRRLLGLGDDAYATRLARETEASLRRYPEWRAGKPLAPEHRQPKAPSVSEVTARYPDKSHGRRDLGRDRQGRRRGGGGGEGGWHDGFYY